MAGVEWVFAGFGGDDLAAPVLSMRFGSHYPAERIAACRA